MPRITAGETKKNVTSSPLINSFAHDPSDSDEQRLEKSTIFLVSASCWGAGCIWTAMYAIVFGWGLTTLLPLAFVIVVGSSLVVSHLTRNHYYAAYAQIICIIYVTTFIQWSIGGLFDSGFVLAWAFCGPFVALIVFSFRESLIWFALYLVNLVITVSFDDFFSSHGHEVAAATRAVFFFMNLSFSSLIVFLFAGYFVGSATIERKRANALLLNILPKEIAPRLKAGEETIADYYASASVMFADMVGSTPLFADMAPAAAVDWLNEVFSMFDRLVEKRGLEKIRTIGDNYMVAAGVPAKRPDHATAIVGLALEMIEGLRRLPPRNGKRLAFRFGINSGPLVAGVIGERKFQYDLWGDTVNVASRMESSGEVGKVHVSASTHALVQDEFECVSRGARTIKGRGEMETWFVLGAKSGSLPASRLDKLG